jgi:maltose/moltooligosaccharide transporter
MSFGFLGIQFGWGLQMANMSSIYGMLGAKEEDLALLWIAAPLTGLLVQPIIGYMSDRTWNRFGRRRPYFLVGAVLASLALIAMPNSGALWMAVGLLWVLDASINITMEPFRAFVADKLPPEQRQSGFSVQALFIGLGAVVSSALPWMMTNWFNVSRSAESGAIPDSVRLSFYIGAAAFFVAVVYTVVSTPEYPPDDLAEFERMKRESAGVGGFFRELAHGLANMPATMRQLAVVQFFTWVGLFCMWIYFTPTIARTAFGGDPVADPEGWAAITAKAGEWTGVCFSVYNLVCFLFSFVLVALSRSVSAKVLHMVCLTAGALGLMLVPVLGSKAALIVSMVGVGIAWASILSMPYSMLSAALPAARMGFYMGVFNFFIVLPQILVSVAMGKVVEHLLGGNSVGAVVIGGACMLVAAVFTLRVRPAQAAA